MQSISIQSTQNAAATISWQRCTQFSEFSLSSASFPNQLPDRHIIASLFSHHFFFHMSKNAMSIQFFYITDLHPTCLQPFFPFVLNHWTSSKIVDSLFMTYWPPLFIYFFGLSEWKLMNSIALISGMDQKNFFASNYFLSSCHCYSSIMKPGS